MWALGPGPRKGSDQGLGMMFKAFQDLAWCSVDEKHAQENAGLPPPFSSPLARMVPPCSPQSYLLQLGLCSRRPLPRARSPPAALLCGTLPHASSFSSDITFPWKAPLHSKAPPPPESWVSPTTQVARVQSPRTFAHFGEFFQGQGWGP